MGDDNVKILIIADEVWNDQIHGNNVLTNWFEGFDAEFAQIFCSPGIPKNNVCSSYFQITDKMMFKSMFTSYRAGNRFFLYGLDSDKNMKEMPFCEPENIKLYRFLKNITGDFLRIIRQIIWCLGHYDKNKLNKFLLDEKPDIIFVPRYSTLKLLRLEKYVMDYLNVPIIAFTGDDGSTKYDVKIVKAAGGVSYANLTGEGKVTGLAEGDRVAYFYDNVVIPQNDLPTVNVEMKSMTLLAKARRVAVYYSQIAAFQAKTDYGFDLGDQLAEKAVGQLQYEIDTEVTNLLIETAGDPVGDLVWSKTLPVGVSKRDHYEGFAEVIGIGKKMIYDRTRRFAPNYMIASSDILPILGFISGFTAAPASNINGPYFAGTLDGIKVYITPNIESGVFALGVNGDDFMSSVAVYAPYLPVIPTQLLGFADGSLSRGWSTMYDLKVLNKDLIVAGKIVA